MPKVSIIIPVHNVGPYVERCVKSVTDQSLRDIEIICVDDASTDESPQILARLAKHDPRVKVLTLAKNLSASQARKDGVLASTGETVMFLDGDDTLVSHACEKAYLAMRQNKVDVLHFGSKVVNCVNAPESRVQWNQNKVAPCLERIDGDLVVACFHQKKFFFTLWNKIFDGGVARKAFSHVQDGRFPRAQDLYAVFLLLYFSRTYVGIRDVLHQYNYGTGITGNRVYALSSFERFSQASWVANAIASFVEQVGATEKYGQILSEIRRNLLTDTLSQWLGHLSPEDAATGYDMLARDWGEEELVAELAERSISEPKKFDAKLIATRIRHAKAISSKRPKKPKVIGVFYYRYHSGGVQRVISLLMPLFQEWGYKVVLITEECEPGNEYPLPDGVTRELIPAYVRKKPINYRDRAKALAQVIRKHKIDVFNSHASSGPEVLFDMILAQSLGCYVVLCRHELAFSSFLNGTDLTVRQPSIFVLADKVACLTRMDEQYYKFMGVPAVYVPNPLPQMSIQPMRSHEAAPVILWVGRLDFTQKQCLEPVEIMSEVVQSVPDAKLLMVGGGWAQDAKEKLLERIEALKLTKNVELCGYTPHPEIYYRKAACHLMTSSWENYPMVIEESRTFGLPLVLYDLPYLELLQSRKGYIAVGQMDRQGAASAIVRLLESPDLRAQIGKEAQEEVAASDNALLEKRWAQILAFGREPDAVEDRFDVCQFQYLINSMLQFYGKGLARKQEELAAVKAELKKAAAPVSSAAGKSPTPVSKPSRPELPQVSETIPSLEVTGRSLEALKKRREKFGPLGALDFLIRKQEVL